MRIKALFLDRDGIVNLMVKKYSRYYDKIMDDTPFKLEELVINTEIKPLVEAAKKKGYLPIIVTNQPSIAKGDSSLTDFENISSEICKFLDIKKSQIFACFHRPPITPECDCRKPKPGLFFQAEKEHNIDLENSIMVGDSSSDILAANNAGVRKTFYLRRKKSESQIGNSLDESKMSAEGIKPTKICDTLSEIEEYL